MKLSCPKYEHEIMSEDINMNKFSEAVSQEKLKDIYSNIPNKCKIREDFDGEALVINFSSTIIIICFSLLLVFWGGFSIGGIYIVSILKGTLTMEQAVSGIPFLIITIILGIALLYIIFRRAEIKVAGDMFQYFNGIGMIGIKRSVNLTQVKCAIIRKTTTKSGNDYCHQLVLKGDFTKDKKELKFFTSTNNDVLNFVRLFILANNKTIK